MILLPGSLERRSLSATEEKSTAPTLKGATNLGTSRKLRAGDTRVAGRGMTATLNPCLCRIVVAMSQRMMMVLSLER